MKTNIYPLIALTLIITSCNSNTPSYKSEAFASDSAVYGTNYLVEDASLYEDQVSVNIEQPVYDGNPMNSLDYESYVEIDGGCEESNSIPQRQGGSFTIHDTHGNFVHGYTDAYGNTSGWDAEGNYFHSHTDDFGNTSGWDSNGNYYHSHTDDFGNTSGWDNNGNYYHSHTDDFGNTSGWDSNGNYYHGYTDDFGNTTIYGY
ncbi:MAG: hypothetical protein IKO20_00180 [Bacteroidaceae bacterium]|nr:hypothetical protein [Bacteroidaceae bacterium]